VVAEAGFVNPVSIVALPEIGAQMGERAMNQSAAAKCAIWSACALTNAGRAVARAT
jgi:hypothetical protein